MEETAKMLTSRSEVHARRKTQKSGTLCTIIKKLEKTKARFYGPFSFYTNDSKHAGAKLQKTFSSFRFYEFRIIPH